MEDKFCTFDIFGTTVRLPYYIFLNRVSEFEREMFKKGTPVEFEVFPTRLEGYYKCYILTKIRTDILSNDCPSFDGWYVDESEEMHTVFDSDIVTRSFHARRLYEGANIIFTLEEKEVEH